MVPPVQYHRRQLVEKQLRNLTGLSARHGIRRAHQEFYRQDQALEALKKLVDSEAFSASQVSLFAREVGAGGKRRFLVDTFANFVQSCAPESWSDEFHGHFYEVILERRPCWLYFDLEYSIESNPSLEAAAVMDAFWDTFAAFCRDDLGMCIDRSSSIELESSTPRKFSRHVIVKCLQCLQTSEKKPLAFSNNAQAGLLVNHLVRYAASHRDLAQLLFVAPQTPRELQSEVCIIDESVYSRNRSFRLLFQSKFGKSRPLELEPISASSFFETKPLPCVALLQTMASFVPPGTSLFQHGIIPADYAHPDRVVRTLRGGGVVHGMDQCDPLLNYLMRAWDDMREVNEGKASHPATVVQSCVQLSETKLTVTLGNNRFCFCKRASHLSNHIYLVVDLVEATYYQKCFDPDCRGYGSAVEKIPSWIVQSMIEEEAFMKAVEEDFQAEERPAKRVRVEDGGA